MRIKSQLTLSVFLLPLWREPLFPVWGLPKRRQAPWPVYVPLSSCSQAEEPSSTAVWVWICTCPGTKMDPLVPCGWGSLFEGSSYRSRMLVVTALSLGIHKCGKRKCPKLNLVSFFPRKLGNIFFFCGSNFLLSFIRILEAFFLPGLYLVGSRHRHFNFKLLCLGL